MVWYTLSINTTYIRTHYLSRAEIIFLSYCKSFINVIIYGPYRKFNPIKNGVYILVEASIWIKIASRG